jgi:hypothetical protein
MPLNDIKPNSWHWTQAVAWIGFNFADPIEGNVYDLGILPSKGGADDIHKVQEICTRAIQQLVKEVCKGTLVSISVGTKRDYMGRSFNPLPMSEEEQSSVTKCLLFNFRGDQAHPLASIPDDISFFLSARFRRDDVLKVWPAQALDTETDNTSSKAEAMEAAQADDKQPLQKPAPAPKKERRGNPNFARGEYYEILEKRLKSMAISFNEKGQNLGEWFDGMTYVEFREAVELAFLNKCELPSDRTLHDSGRKIVAKIENR